MSNSVTATSEIPDAARAARAPAVPLLWPAFRWLCDPMPSIGMPAAIHFLTWVTMPIVTLG